MMLDLDAAIGGLSSSMSFKVHAMANRSGLPGLATVNAHSHRLVADLKSSISMRKADYEAWFEFHDNQLNNGRSRFTSSNIKEITGADVLVMQFSGDDPKLMSFDKTAGQLDISMRVNARVIDELPFELCRYVLSRGFSVQRFSTNHDVDLVGGDVSRVGAFFGEQYTVECGLKLFQEEFKALLSWYLVTLKGGSEKFQADWLGDVDSRLANKTVMFAGGLDCQFAQGEVNIKIKLWVVNESVTIGVLGTP